MKKLTALLLTMAFIICLAPAAAFAEGDTAAVDTDTVITEEQAQPTGASDGAASITEETTGATITEKSAEPAQVTSKAAAAYTVKASGKTAYVGDKLTYTFTTPKSITSVHAFINRTEVGKTTSYTQSGDTRTWKMTINCTKAGTYEVQFVAAKNGKGVKIMPDDAYTVKVKAVPNTYKVTPEQSTIVTDETVKCAIVTPKTATKVSFVSEGKVIDSTTTSKTNTDGTKSWTLSMKFATAGKKSLTFNVYTGSKITKTKTYTINVGKGATKLESFEMISTDVTPNLDGNPTFIIAATNTPKVTLVIYDSDGDKVATLLSKDTMQGEKMSAVWRLGKQYLPGKYKARLTIDSGVGDAVTSEIDFKVNARTASESGEADYDISTGTGPDINDEDVSIDGDVSSESKEMISKLIAAAKSKLGYPYVLGGKGPNVFDCSGFVYWCLNKAGYEIKYMTSSGWGSCTKFKKISKMKDLKAGDIICFQGHVGISLGNDMMIDASSSDGVIRICKNISSTSYWVSHFRHGCRIFE